MQASVRAADRITRIRPQDFYHGLAVVEVFFYAVKDLGILTCLYERVQGAGNILQQCGTAGTCVGCGLAD